MDEFEIEVRLPLGAVIIDERKLASIGLKPFMPEWGKVASDGRQIFVQWRFDKPTLGSTVEIDVIYEQILEASQVMTIVTSFLTILFLVFLAVSFRKKSRIKEILPVLNENERKVMMLLLTQKKKEIDQRKIARELDFSKSKLSRIIKDLEERGLIEVIRKGRSNKIRLAFERRRKK
jgi:DNA-binding transcriptional ArsR family regulator